jgi:hypothetical protein
LRWRRAGEILNDSEKAKGGGDQRSEQRSARPTSGPKTLSDLGISKEQLGELSTKKPILCEKK